jgi:hypothetical protein
MIYKKLKLIKPKLSGVASEQLGNELDDYLTFSIFVSLDNLKRPVRELLKNELYQG